ncbi:piggyBac transposable element-derived protein 3-like [Belonocnema kinseyi]|uniref:piggyBac transposable element-derived protein 3-like n=1 Tax=Belonocnema kinseyi TaxID=2817044 RepID=UPI00143CFCE2|nr:piggyBac transposable element-derived protein 3-like [Belonocnema kinseyi]
MRIFIAILLMSGYNRVPDKRAYWEDCEDVHNPMVSRAMRKNRFLEISKFPHCAPNNDINEKDAMYKLRPLIAFLQRKFRDLMISKKYYDYDESMIPYYGPHGCKEFIRGKFIRVGYKACCLNASQGYLVDFDIYQGKSPEEKEDYGKKFGKCAAPLVHMLDRLPENVKTLPLMFYFDLFTGLNLLKELKSRGYGGTGTMRENRVPKDCSLKPVINMKKEARGSLDYRTSNDDVIIARWVDNSVVTVGSTVHGIEPVINATRYSQKHKKRIQVPRPNLFTQYNKNMGGTDRRDQNVSLYQISFRNKKWWWSIFIWLLDVSVCNAWMLARSTGDDVSQLTFRRTIVQTYLKRYGVAPMTPRVRPINVFSRVAMEIRYDNTGHYVAWIPNQKRRRCAYEYCSSSTRTECVKCDIGLCVGCFLDFHVYREY